MQSYKRKFKETTVSYCISSISMKRVIYFIESIKIIQKINIEQILQFYIIDYSNSFIKLHFLSANKEQNEELLDQLLINNTIGSSIEGLLSLLTNDEERENVIENEELLIENNIINQNWENNEILKSLLISNDYYFVSYHPLERRIKRDIDMLCNEYFQQSNNNNNSLKLWNFKIGDIGLEYLCMRFNLMSSLLKLNLNSSGIRNLGLSYLSNSLKYIQNLQELWLHCNNITHNGIRSLCNNLHYISNLNKLGMNRNYISDKGVICLCKYLSYITNLIHLDIGYNCVSEEGVRELCNNLHFISKLKKLNLRENRFYDSCDNLLIDKLKLCPELEYLDIEGEEMPKEEINERIKKNHPNNNLNIVKIRK